MAFFWGIDRVDHMENQKPTFRQPGQVTSQQKSSAAGSVFTAYSELIATQKQN